MSRTGAILGAAAILALGGYAALPDDEPAYLGDFPSALEQQAAERSPAPRSEPGPAAGGPPPPVQGPSPVVPESPAGGGGTPGERVPDPAVDTSRDVEAGSTPGDDVVQPARPGLPQLFAEVIDTVEEVTDCVVDGILTLPDGGLLDCVTGLPLPLELPGASPIDPTDPVDPLEPVLGTGTP